MKQVTFMMLKPDAFANHQEDEVVAMLTAHGLCIEKSCRLEVTMEVMKVLLDHYHGVIDAMDKEFNFPGNYLRLFITMVQDTFSQCVSVMMVKKILSH